MDALVHLYSVIWHINETSEDLKGVHIGMYVCRIKAGICQVKHFLIKNYLHFKRQRAVLAYASQHRTENESFADLHMQVIANYVNRVDKKPKSLRLDSVLY